MGNSKKDTDNKEKVLGNEEEIDKYEDEKYYNSKPEYSDSLPDCPKCGATMRYNNINSKFKCFSCGYEVDEYDLVYERQDSEMPYCCKACGGPWPKCQTSCKIFDD